MAVVNKDKMAVMQVLGSLIKEPLLLLKPEYPLEVEYFPETFHRYLFEAIEHLIKNKATKITFTDIDNLLSNFPNRHTIFKDNRGIEYVQNITEFAEVENYPYYYNVLKKMALLNDLARLGFDSTQVYNPNLVDKAQSIVMQEKFDKMSIDDILAVYLVPLSSVKGKYSISSEIKKYKAGEKAKQLKESFKEAPEMGLPLNSKKLTTIFRGRRLEKYYVKTAVTSLGKTRHSVADACLISLKEIYDLEKCEWVKNDYCTPTLIIVTEQVWKEIEPMLWAYAAGVEQMNITQNTYGKFEEARVDKAIQVIKDSPLYYTVVDSYNYEDIELIVMEHKQKYGITHVFFDYLHENEKLLAETSFRSGTRNLRTDQILGMVSAKLKGLTNRLNIHLDTSTQSNDQIKNVLFADQSVIRGSKAIGDKPDIAYVIMPLSKEDETFAKQNKKGFTEMPNLVYHVYKVRSGRINKVKVWVHFDYGTLRTIDCFVTKANNELIKVPDTEIQMILDNRDTEVSTKEVEKDFSEKKRYTKKSTKTKKLPYNFDEDDF